MLVKGILQNDVNTIDQKYKGLSMLYKCHMEIQKVCNNWNAYLKQVRWELEAVPCSMYWFLHGITIYYMYSHMLSALWHLSWLSLLIYLITLRLLWCEARTISFGLYLNKLCQSLSLFGICFSVCISEVFPDFGLVMFCSEKEHVSA